MTAEELWATKYAARHAEERALDEARREQAFLDVPYLVAGEPLRGMTPRDLLMLNGAESPFVCATEMTSAHVALFFWVMHEDNNGSIGWRANRRRNALIRRLAPMGYDELVAAGRDYIEEIFMDAPQGGGGDLNKRPLGTCFLAPLITGIALETGWSQREIMDTPLPRLFQYTKALRARNQGKDFVDSSPSDRLTGEFLAELNSLRN